MAHILIRSVRGPFNNKDDKTEKNETESIYLGCHNYRLLQYFMFVKANLEEILEAII